MASTTLSAVVEQFVYTHAPQMTFKKQLMETIRAGEKLYADRIAELEQEIKALNQVAYEAPKSQAPSICSKCKLYHQLDNDDPMTGTRYFGSD